MKKIIALLLALVMVLGMSGCGSSKKVEIKSIVLSEESITLPEGQTHIVSITLLPETATENVVWKSTNEDIATVDAKGEVLAVAAGITSIIVSGESSGVYATCEIVVPDPSAYEQLSAIEKKFVDRFISYGAPNFVQPDTIEIKSIYYIEDDALGNFWTVKLTNSNGFGGTTGNTYFLLEKAYNGSYFLKGEDSLLSSEEYNIDLINRAIQEKIA